MTLEWHVMKNFSFLMTLERRVKKELVPRDDTRMACKEGTCS